MTTSPTYLAVAERLAEWRGVKVIWADGPARSNPATFRRSPADLEPGTIQAPYPGSARAFAEFAHELGHIYWEPSAAKHGWISAKVEARASAHALETFDEWLLPGKDEAADHLGRKLLPFLDDALRRGVWAPEEVRREVRADLLAYPDKLAAVTASNGRLSDDELEDMYSKGWPPV